MKGKQALIISIFLLTIVFSQLASAGWFSGFWLRITGKAVNAPTYCSDSELPGYSVKGTVTVIRPLSIDKYEDYCIDANTLLEYNCNYTNVIDGIGDVYNKTYVCPAGCSEGACNETVCNPVAKYCDNQTLKACRADGSGWDITNCFEQQKMCGSGACVERYCTPGETKCDSYPTYPTAVRICNDIGSNFLYIPCPSGQNCVNGTCVSVPCSAESEKLKISCCAGLVSIYAGTSAYCTKCYDGICQYPENESSCPADCSNQTNCTDSDGGRNYYLKGTTKDMSGYIRTDQCIVSKIYQNGFRTINKLTEYSCNPYGYYNTEYFDCPHGCADGACIQNDSQSICGNGICEHDEDFSSCKTDCCGREGDKSLALGACCDGLKAVLDMPDLQPPCGEALNSMNRFCTKCGDGICIPPENRCNCQIDCLKTAVCGNGRCELSFENRTSCPADCSTCGDGYCAGAPYETASSCVWDCSVCGDGICGSPKETAAFCPTDCLVGEGNNSVPCLSEGKIAYSSCCPGLTKIRALVNDETCDTLIAGNPGYCTNCGDGVCRSPENKCSCPSDCIVAPVPTPPPVPAPVTFNCSAVSNGICPSECTILTDADCCVDSKRYWLKTPTGYLCSIANYSKGCSAESSCSAVEDGCCLSWCSLFYDADCCKISGRCWGETGCTRCDVLVSGNCTDTDGGIYRDKKGTCTISSAVNSTINSTNTVSYEDYCLSDGMTLTEFYCGKKNASAKMECLSFAYTCDEHDSGQRFTCDNGRCISNVSVLCGNGVCDTYEMYSNCPSDCPSCSGEGGMFSYVSPGFITCCSGLTAIPPLPGENCPGIFDYPSYFTSGYCTKCGDGICRSPENKCNCARDCQRVTGPVALIEEPVPDVISENSSSQNVSELCDGCVSNGACISSGTRNERYYCDSSGSMLAQKPDSSLCLNSYECESSRCFENECAPQLTFIARIAEWFRAIFTP